MKAVSRRVGRWLLRWFIDNIVRDLWLTVIVYLGDRALYTDYRRRFRVSRDEFRYEVKAKHRFFDLTWAALTGNVNRYFYLLNHPLD
jgi:hypothetical protein